MSEQINHPSEPCTFGPGKLRIRSGYDILLAPLGDSLCLDDSEAAEYDKNPDLWAARYLGFGDDVETYRQYARLDGYAFCGATTKKGNYCSNLVNNNPMTAADWLKSHRKGHCAIHRHFLKKQEAAKAAAKEKPPVIG